MTAGLIEASKQRDLASRIVSYLESLISFSTAYPPGDTSHIARYLYETFAEMGFATEIYSTVAGLDNVVARMGSGTPSLVFNVHVDTVDSGDPVLWSRPPLEATVEDGFVYGLGAANCKGSGAVQLWLAGEISRRGGPAIGEVVFTYVADEESLGPNGMRFLRELGIIKPDMLLLGAPTANSITTEERGVLWVEVTALGKAAHAGQPDDGDNAIVRMARVIDHLNREMSSLLSRRIDGEMRSTFNIGLVRGGQNTNVVPSWCSAELDRRLLPSESVDEALAEIVSVIKSSGEPRVSVKRLRGTNGFKAKDGGPLVSALKAAIEDITGLPATFAPAIGVSDGRYFANDDIEIVNFGPGEGNMGHASNECVSLASLKESALILDRLTNNLVGYLN